MVDELLNRDEKDIIAQAIRFLKYAYEGDRKKALEAITEDLNTFGWRDPEQVWQAAGCFAMIEEIDMALKWLEHAIERGWINYPLFAINDPFLENIRSEPRFKKLIEMVKHEWVGFEV